MRLLGPAVLTALVVAFGLAATGDPAPASATRTYGASRTTASAYGALSPPVEAAVPELETTLVAAGFDRPTSAVDPGDGRLFVTEKGGAIRVVVGNQLSPDLLLDLRGRLPDHRTEQGLLSMALHPDFSTNGRFYVDLTDTHGDVRVIEYEMSADGSAADPASSRLVMLVDQPGQFHNGGMLQFGPDGYLYVSFGDGHFGRSAINAQTRENVLGSIVRIDVDAGDPYAIPADNPFVGTRFAPEVWLYGMRNPWRFSIDSVDRVMVVGDVGQFRWEEITVLPLDRPGLNLGWPVLEGDQCYDATSCDRSGTVLPSITYSHAAGCAVVAGPVYRGAAIPELEGMVVYSDFCTGVVRAFGLIDGHVVRHVDLIAAGSHGPVLSIAADSAGEILLLTQAGELRRLEPSRG